MRAEEFWCRAFLAAMDAGYADPARRSMSHDEMALYGEQAADAAVSVAQRRGMVTSGHAPDARPATTRERITVYSVDRTGDLWTISGPEIGGRGIQVHAGREAYPMGNGVTVRIVWGETMPPKPIEVWLERHNGGAK